MKYSTAFIDKQREFEGSFDYMYLDSKGFVTVGIGHLLPTAADAAGLPFVITRTPVPDPKLPLFKPEPKLDKATAAEIKSDYAAVKKQAVGKRESAYASATKVRLPQSEIDRLLTADLDDAIIQLRSRYSKIDDWPQSAREAVLDMAFNMGGNFFDTWPKFKKAVEEQDWATAAKECHGSDIQQSRNDWRKKQFEDAVPKPKK